MQTDDERRTRWPAVGMCHTPGYPAPRPPKYGDLTGQEPVLAEIIESGALQQMINDYERDRENHDIWITTEPIAPRRRWWHRLTRR